MADFLMVTNNNLESIAVSGLVEKFGHRLTKLTSSEVTDQHSLFSISALGIIDADNIGTQATEVTEFLRGVCKNVPVVWLAKCIEDETIHYASMACGASGCLSKTEVDTLVQSLERAANGEPLYSKRMLMSFIRSVSPLTPVITTSLTEREKEILEMLQRGSTNREIAKQLSLSVETIKHCVADLKKVLRLKHRRQFSMGVTTVALRQTEKALD